MTKYYIVVEKDDLTLEMVNASLEDPRYIRWSKSGDRCILKFCCFMPDCAKGYTKYTHEEIKEILKESTLLGGNKW